MPNSVPKTVKSTAGSQNVIYRDANGKVRAAVVLGRGSNANQQQTLTMSGTPTSGTFTVTVGGQTTAGIAWNATSAAVASAINALSNFTANQVTATGGPISTTPVVVTFGTGSGSLGLATINNGSLVGGTVAASISRGFAATSLKVIVESLRGSSSASATKDNVLLATSLKQTNVYFNR